MPMKVLHVISNLMSGGAEAMLSKLARATEGADVHHVVLSLMSGGKFANEISNAGIPVIGLGLGRNVRAIASVRSIIEQTRRIQPDIIQGWMYHANVAASIAGIFSSHFPPLLWNIRQTLQHLRDETMLTRATIMASSLLSWQPSKLIYNSIRSAEDHERLGFRRSARVILPNGFDLDRFKPDQQRRQAFRQSLGISETALVIGRVASLHPRKDIDTLFTAFAPIAAAEPNAHLVLIGRGMTLDEPKITTLTASSPDPIRVHALGERTDLEYIYPGFDLSISSSSHAEAFPNVIGEAMACGVPSIATDVGESATIIGDPSRVVPPRNPMALSDCALRLLALTNDSRTKMGLRDRGRITEFFSLNQVAKGYLSLWQSVIQAR
jgi:glycosyltransferase involved in cell wall biosynthesis